MGLQVGVGGDRGGNDPKMSISYKKIDSTNVLKTVQALTRKGQGPRAKDGTRGQKN